MKASNKIILLIITSFVLVAFIDGYFLYFKEQESVTFLPHSLFIAFCLFAWCKQHARENAVEKLKYFPLMCALFSFIGVPAYGYAKFGFKAGNKILAVFVGYIALTVLLIGSIDFFVKRMAM